MGIINSKGCIKIPGNKELTQGKKPVVLKDISKVYFPCVAADGKEVNLKVKVGSSVKVGTVLGIQQGSELPCHSSVSGKIVGIEKRFNALVGRPIDNLIIENDFKETEEESLKKISFAKATKEEIVERMKEAGIVGLGGAGFPTYIKYEAKGIETVIINAIECAPYLTNGIVEIMQKVSLFVEGAALLVKAAGAKVGIIAVKEADKEASAAIKKEAAKHPSIKVKVFADAYPIGYERILVKEILHKEYNEVPSEVGVIVSNSSTAIAVAEAVINGKPLTHRVITVSGDAIAKPQVVIAPIGTPACDIIAKCGGYTKEEIVLVPGVPMSVKSQMNEQFVTEKSMGALIALEYKEVEEHPCMNCGRCTIVCPLGLQPVEIKRQAIAKNVPMLKKLQADICCECGLCAYICPSKINVVEYIKKAKLQLKLDAAKQK